MPAAGPLGLAAIPPAVTATAMTTTRVRLRPRMQSRLRAGIGVAILLLLACATWAAAASPSDPPAPSDPPPSDPPADSDSPPAALGQLASLRPPVHSAPIRVQVIRDGCDVQVSTQRKSAQRAQGQGEREAQSARLMGQTRCLRQ